METKELFYQLGATFILLGVIILNISSFTMKRAGLWHSVKAFGVEVPNWSFDKSMRLFLSNKYLIDPKLKYRLFFQWKLGIMLIVLGLVSFLISEFAA